MPDPFSGDEGGQNKDRLACFTNVSQSAVGRTDIQQGCCRMRSNPMLVLSVRETFPLPYLTSEMLS